VSVADQHFRLAASEDARGLTTQVAVAAVADAGTSVEALLSRGSLSVVAGQVAASLASLAATHFTVRLLGTERYGMLILIGVITGYAGLADFGMGLASTHFAARAWAEHDVRREVAVIWTSALVLTVPIALICILILLSANAIAASVLPLSGEVARQGATALRLAVCGVFLSALGGIWNTPQVVRLRMFPCTEIASGCSMLQSLLTPLVLFAGGGIVGAAAVGLAVSALILTLHVILAHHCLPETLRPEPRADLVRPLLKFGACAAGTSVALRIVSGIERVVLPRFASITTLAWFAVALAPINVLLIIANTIQPSLVASFGRLRHSGAQASETLFSRALLVCAGALCLTLVAGCAFAGTFFRTWVGPEYATHSTMLFRILAIGAAVNVMAYVPSARIISLGRMDLLTRLYAAEILPYLILTICLVTYSGAVGAAAAWSIRAVIDGIAVFLLASRPIAGNEAAKWT
jgi:O-antigen/teichoic acid export membrane protein